ncbi:MAG: hypothetical protein DHS20C21_14390 [Gemmatimonadota bacterium]|nr:MAG: hypothetical protein DHS20C21_14390 [Gemmatimonadota bacterium]
MEEVKKGLWGTCGNPRRDVANQRRVLVWSLIWAVAVLANAAAIRTEWLPGRSMELAAAAATSLVSVGVLWAYQRYLRETDELRQRIELEALAFTVGVGVFGGMAYSLFHRVLSAGEPDLTYVTAAMMFTYSIGVVVGHRRYS